MRRGAVVGGFRLVNEAPRQVEDVARRERGFQKRRIRQGSAVDVVAAGARQLRALWRRVHPPALAACTTRGPM